jgi:hypothetical protein
VPDAAATREKEGINVEAAVFDDDDEAIRVGEGLYRRVRPKAMKIPVICGPYLVPGYSQVAA